MNRDGARLTAGCWFGSVGLTAFSSEFSLTNVLVKIILPYVLVPLYEVHIYRLSPWDSYEIKK